jgi:hypothetical protein
VRAEEKRAMDSFAKGATHTHTLSRLRAPGMSETQKALHPGGKGGVHGSAVARIG